MFFGGHGIVVLLYCIICVLRGCGAQVVFINDWSFDFSC